MSSYLTNQQVLLYYGFRGKNGFVIDFQNIIDWEFIELLIILRR